MAVRPCGRGAWRMALRAKILEDGPRVRRHQRGSAFHLHQSVTSVAVSPGSPLTAAGIVVHVLRGTMAAAALRGLPTSLRHLLPLLPRPDEADPVFCELELRMMKVKTESVCFDICPNELHSANAGRIRAQCD